MSMNSWTCAKFEVGDLAGFSILACKLSLRVLSTLVMSHQFNRAACRNVWKRIGKFDYVAKETRVMIIQGSINSSVSLLKRNIKELVKLNEIPYGKKVCQQIVLLKKNFVTCFQIMVKLPLTKVMVKMSSLAENFIKFCQQNIYQ